MGIIKKYINYIIIFILIYTSRDTLLVGTSVNENLILLGYLAPVLVLIILLLEKNVNVIVRNNNYVYIFLGLIAITMISNFDINVKYGYELLLVVIAFFISRKILFQDFAQAYCEIMMILTCFAVVSGVVFMISPNVISSFPVIANKGGLYYYNLGLSVIPLSVYGDYYRLYGIFREPGVAMIFINIGLLFELFILEKKQKIGVVIFLAGIVLTFSTAGYFVALMILGAYLLSSNLKSSYRLWGTFCVVILVIAVIRNEFVQNLVFSKFSNEDSMSTAARFGSFYNNINLLIDNPLNIFCGLGYQYVEDAFVQIGNQFHGQGHNTNTILKELAVHGIFFFILILTRFYNFFTIWIRDKKIVIILLILATMAAFCNEDLTVNIILFIFIFYSSRNLYGNANTIKC